MSRHLLSSVRRVTLKRHNSSVGVTFQSASNLSNQLIKSAIDAKLLGIQQNFNFSGLHYSFGYGSGVFPQAGYQNASSSPQIDVIHMVDNPLEFHKLNAAKHPNHYSSLIKLGDYAMQWIQECGAGVYFNPYVSMRDKNGEEVVLKYGIVSSQNALTDIRNWTSLYIAGRLQKPVKHSYNIDEDLRLANEYNLESALNLSLLLLSSRVGSSHITSSQLFEKIASISYMGDPRMIIGGENPNKVKNIISKQLPYFEQLYSRAIEMALSKNYLKRDGLSFCVTLKTSSAAQILAHLPQNFKKRFLNAYKAKYAKVLANDAFLSDFMGSDEPSETIDSSVLSMHAASPYLHEALNDSSSRRVLLSTISSIIALPALSQSIKGIVTAGLVKSVKYAWDKKLKSLGS